MTPVDGRQRVGFAVNRASDIEMALQIAREYSVTRPAMVSERGHD
jgi:hypothetical protein